MFESMVGHSIGWVIGHNFKIKHMKIRMRLDFLFESNVGHCTGRVIGTNLRKITK